MDNSLFRTHRDGDRIMAVVSWALFSLSLALAPFYGTWLVSITMGLCLALASTAAAFWLPTLRLTRLLNAFVFMAFSALLIHEMHGMIEMHFGIFALLAFLLFYRDWLAPVVAAVVISLHHLAFYFLQNQGVAVYAFPQDHVANALGMVFVHAAFVLFETAMLVYMAIVSRREALDADEVASLGSRIGADGTVDLCIARDSAHGRSAHRLEEFLLTIGEAVSGTRAVASQVQADSSALAQITTQITANSSETSSQADLVSRVAETVSQNLRTVATGAEQMGLSIKEIAKNATEAAKIATGAVKIAETTTTTVSKLGDSSTEIGQVIKVITSIAQQTNLLALNATIEAARAGEAGKGFAVVANEVKELAKETAKATEDISRRIEAIQTDTKAAVEAIASISGVINQINEISGTIATAVEEQNATTNEMSRNVNEAAEGSSQITSNISGIAAAAQGTSHGATDTQKASQALAERAAELEHLVGRFKLPRSAGEASIPTRARSAAGASPA